ncbi:hypothetical protein J1605_007846 [Eschrichtius robustus]|uniref:Uncharacterized protein n=1 Tax=Eschrichtius robustus TaxID=9764 RepID=A0AB34GPQ5_ESCRO|nr:hypothetical protein J1605_011388 [Eschrichtius robustus]KAJ8784819.1 hypothetical protein J1605_007846 [Eschrichtius robustus]
MAWIGILAVQHAGDMVFCRSLIHPEPLLPNLCNTDGDLGKETEGKALCSGRQKTAESALQLLFQFPVGCLGNREPTTLSGGVPTEPPGKKSLVHLHIL